MMKKKENEFEELTTMEAKTEHVIDQTNRIISETAGEMIKDIGIGSLFNLDGREYILFKKGMELVNLYSELIKDHAAAIDKITEQQKQIDEQNKKLDQILKAVSKLSSSSKKAIAEEKED